MQRKTSLFAFTATCKGTQLRSATSCTDILQVTNLKGKVGANANVNQASCNSVNGAEQALMPSNQCSISKAQCEQLLAFLKSRAAVGDAHYAASVSISCIAIGGEGASGSISDVVGTFAQTNLNFNLALMSGTNPNVPFVSTLKHSIFLAKTVDRKIFIETDWVIDT